MRMSDWSSDACSSDLKEAIAQCRTAGIRVIMITGDYAATAQAIGAEAGLDAGETLTGPTISTLSDEELSERIKTVSICARTMPAQKLRIEIGRASCRERVCQYV